jgi:putative toxin-antitoxin system antitoxin component (TIGR02293 family)
MAVLTSDDLAEIKRLIEEVVAETSLNTCDLNWLRTFESDSAEAPKRVRHKPTLLPAVVDITARAIEVLGTREKALRWLKTPVRTLDDKTPLSLLGGPDGIMRVEDVLGRTEHGVW